MTESAPPPLANRAGEVARVELDATIDPLPLGNGDPYVLIIFDSIQSRGDTLKIILRAGGLDGPLSTYGLLRSVLATLASDGDVHDEITGHVRAAIRGMLVEAGVAKEEADDPPWLTELLDDLVGVAVAR